MKTKIIFIFLSLCLFVTNSFSQNADINLLRNINLHRNKNLDAGFRFISNTALPVSLAIPIGFLAKSWIQHDKALVKKGIVSGASLVLAITLTTSLKYAVNRDRPYITYPDIDNQINGGGSSFPSGHTTVAFATAASLSFAYPKWYIIVPSFAYASAVAYSRMHLGVHYPGDILGGMLVGVGSSFLCYKAQKWFKEL